MTRPRLSHRALPRRLSLLTRQQSTATTPSPSPIHHHHQQQQQPIHDPHALLSRPTWSVRALLPQTTTTTTPTTQPTTTTPTTKPTTDPSPSPEDTITPSQLTHLHRLSALPPPANPAATSDILSTLHAQLHFVRAIQRVDTTSIPPLSSIRDETAAGRAEAAITLDTPAVREALAREVAWGRCRRPRRRAPQNGATPPGQKDGERKVGEEEEWDVLGSAAEKAGGGRYFVVRSGKGTQEANGNGAESGIAG